MVRKKTKSLFFKFENFLKKYQVSLSIILSTLLSVIAIIVSLNANTISRKEYEKNRVPVWDYKIINEENGSTRELQIVSLKPDIRLESFEAITPFNKTDKEIIISTKDILNLFDLENKILAHRNNLYTTIINKDELIPETVKIDEAYPVILKIKYVLDNEIFYDYSFYKLNLRIFNNDFVKIISLSFIQKINEKDAQHLAAFLDYINKTECIEKVYFSGSDELFKSLENKDSTTAGFITWCNYYGQSACASHPPRR